MKIKRALGFFVLIIITFSIFGCDYQNKKEQQQEPSPNSEIITYQKASQTLTVGETFTLNRYINLTAVNYESSNEDVVKITSRFGYALSVGYALITAKSTKTGEVVSSFLVNVVENKPSSISITNYRDVEIGESISLGCSIVPTNAQSDLVWKSSDEAVATINNNGYLTGIASGFTRITVYDKRDETINDEVIIYVKQNKVETGGINNEYQNVKIEIDLSTVKDVFIPVINKARSYTIGVKSYKALGSRLVTLASASGVIFERYCILKDGSLVLDDGNIKDFVRYRYNVITCKHIIDGASSVEIYCDETTIEAEIISFDTKIDLGIITFEDTRFFPVASFADSDNVETGEFVIAVGNSYGEDYYGSSTLGIVSSYSRYVSTDTDGDGTNDWDSLYIQHDAAIGDGSSGGPLINMKGEIIGINSEKILNAKIDNMCFAIPSNLTLELCNQLKEGIVPARPIFKISVLTVRDIINNDYLLELYPIPSGITYGIYIAEVDKGGVGDACGMQPGDIIVEFDGKKITYSYELRAAMGQVIIGSNEEINVVVYRNGEYITLKAVF